MARTPTLSTLFLSSGSDRDYCLVMSSVVLSPPPAGASSWQKVDGKWKTVVCQVKPVALPPRPDRDPDLEVNNIRIFCSVKCMVKYIQ